MRELTISWGSLAFLEPSSTSGLVRPASSVGLSCPFHAKLTETPQVGRRQWQRYVEKGSKGEKRRERFQNIAHAQNRSSHVYILISCSGMLCLQEILVSLLSPAMHRHIFQNRIYSSFPESRHELYVTNAAAFKSGTEHCALQII